MPNVIHQMTIMIIKYRTLTTVYIIKLMKKAVVSKSLNQSRTLNQRPIDEIAARPLWVTIPKGQSSSKLLTSTIMFRVRYKQSFKFQKLRK